jgi:phosphatidylglycerol:prolipoprotein diacylglycerol transferase
MVAVGALVGLWFFHRELQFAKLPGDTVDVGIAGVVGGLFGAKVLWVFEHLGDEPFTSLLFSRGGMSWFGGFAGGILAGVWLMRRRRLNVLAVLTAATPGLAVGHAIGRIGCLLVGDDYGRPSNLPWAVAFPEGLPPTTVPVHPTQIYEALGLIPIAFFLIRWRRQGQSNRVVLGRYLVAAGLLRFLIEFLRVDVRIVAGLSVAHLASIGVIIAGLILLRARR